MEDSLTAGKLAALLKTRRDEAAAAASTATARILLDVFAVAERDDFDVRFRCGHQDSLGRLRRGRARRLCSSVPLGVSVLDSGRRRPEQVRRSDERRPPRVVCLRVASASARGTLSLRQPVKHCVLPLQRVVRLGAVRTTRDFGSTSSRLIGSRASTRTGSRTSAVAQAESEWYACNASDRGRLQVWNAASNRRPLARLGWYAATGVAQWAARGVVCRDRGRPQVGTAASNRRPLVFLGWNSATWWRRQRARGIPRSRKAASVERRLKSEAARGS